MLINGFFVKNML